MSKKTLTIFTPTYNRGYCIHLVYESLLRQTSKDFLWLIVDDGSVDDTKNIVGSWINDGAIEIAYISQENQGMVAAHNTAHYHIDTEINVCIDSDDFMPDDAVEKIVNYWIANRRPDLMGLVGLDAYKNGNIIGIRFPDNLYECKFSEIYTKYKVYGDKKYVLRSDLIKQHLPYPSFKGEKFPAPSYLYLFLEQKYDFLICNDIFCIVEYLPDGNSMNKLKQYRNSPNSYACYRIAKMKFALNYKERFKNAIHYVSSCLFAKKKDILKASPFKFTTIAALPLGYFLYLYIKNTKNTAANKKLNKN